MSIGEIIGEGFKWLVISGIVGVFLWNLYKSVCIHKWKIITTHPDGTPCHIKYRVCEKCNHVESCLCNGDY